MKNEIEKRKSGDILFEPPEPLFPEGFPQRRRRLPVILSGCILLAVILFIIAAVTFREVDGDGKGSQSEFEGNGATESESVTAFGNETESELESEPENAVESEPESCFESEAPSEEGGFTDAETEPSVVEVDLSLIERGEDYVVNYSDRAIDVEGLIDRGFIDWDEACGSAPLVLVLHTHTGEGYLSGGSGYRGPSSVVSVGDALVSRLNALGVGAIHCTVIHEGGKENAYANAADTIKTMLKIYPSIRYVVDLHRLGLESGGTLSKTVSGCADGSAQIRLTVGAQDEGDGWQENLSLALVLRSRLNEEGRVCMPPVVSPSIPNSDLCDYYIMVDVGASGNTVEEAMAAGRRLGDAMAEVLNGK